MYRNVKLRVRVDGELGDPFSSEMGVKQGDPLSPLLFGLFIDRICETVRREVPDGDVWCEDIMLQVLLYADDMVLLAHDPGVLQRYLDVLHGFCEATGMAVNVAKSEVVVFHADLLPQQRAGRWRFNSTFLKVSKEFVYLGVVLDSKDMSQSVWKSVKRRAEKARGALFARIGVCHGMSVYNPEVLSALFDGIVAPSALYGAEVWGPDVIVHAKPGLVYKALEDVHALFMRMVLWVGKPTPHAVMRKELGRDPLTVACVSRVEAFWNKLVKLGEGSVLYKAARESIMCVEDGWCSRVQRMVHKIGLESWSMVCGQALNKIPYGACHKGAINCVDKTCALEVEGLRQRAISVHQSGSFVHAVADSDSKGFKSFKHEVWFDTRARQSGDKPYIFGFHQVSDIRHMAMFRCGMHWLATEKNRAVGGRSHRLCPVCNAGHREDELHALVCPAYADLRAVFTGVFQRQAFTELERCYWARDKNVDEHMRAFLDIREVDCMHEFAAFLRLSRRLRTAIMNG
jgi:hypothetical protein